MLPRLFAFLSERDVTDVRDVNEADVVAFLSERKAAITTRGGLPSDNTVYVHFVTVKMASPSFSRSPFVNVASPSTS